MSAIDSSAHRPWDGVPINLADALVGACRCTPEYTKRGLIDPACDADTIIDLCQQVDRLRALLARAKDHIDPNGDQAALDLLRECEEAVG